MPIASSASRKRGWSQPLRDFCSATGRWCLRSSMASARGRSTGRSFPPSASEIEPRSSETTMQSASRALREAERRGVTRAHVGELLAVGREREVDRERRDAVRRAPRRRRGPASWRRTARAAAAPRAARRARCRPRRDGRSARGAAPRSARRCARRRAARRAHRDHGRARRAARSSSLRRRDTDAPTCSKMRRRSSWKTTTSTSTRTAKKAWKIAAVSCERRAGARPGRSPPSVPRPSERRPRARAAHEAQAQPGERRDDADVDQVEEADVAQQVDHDGLVALRRPRARCARGAGAARGAATPRARSRDTGPTSVRSPRRGRRPSRAVTWPPIVSYLLVLFSVDLEVEAVADLGHRHAAAELVDARRDLHELGLVHVELVAEGPHDLLERVLAEREADHGAVLVHHGGAVRALALQLEQEVRERHRVRHEDALARQLAQVGLLVAAQHGRRARPSRDDADDRVEAALAERDSACGSLSRSTRRYSSNGHSSERIRRRRRAAR